MKYETPEVTALTPAINAIQITSGTKNSSNDDSPNPNPDVSPAYQDWE